jgi:hypothetical protein
MSLSGNPSLLSGRFSFGSTGREKPKSARHSNLIFLSRLVLFFIAVYLLWIFFMPVSNEIFTFFSGKTIMLVETHFTKSVIAKGREIFIYFTPSLNGTPLVFKYYYYTYNGVFLAALILAVPGVNLKLRLKILILGMILISAVQITSFVLSVFSHYSKHMVTYDKKAFYPIFWRTIFQYGDGILTRLNGQLIPLIIWAGLFYYYKWHKTFVKRLRSHTPKHWLSCLSVYPEEYRRWPW